MGPARHGGSPESVPWFLRARKVRVLVAYRLIIFDLDGTLSDSFPWFLSVVSAVADKHGFRRVDDVEALRGKSAREILKVLNVPLWRVPWIARDMRQLKSRSLDRIPLFPGVPEMLAALRQRGLTIALVSSDSEANARRALGSSVSCISHFACGASLFGKAKKFKQVMTWAGVPAAATLTIGDEARDAEAAKAAGIDFAGVAWGYSTVAALAQADPVVVFAGVSEIPVWLAGAE
jgi:phosphoglycolate phosphatase